MLAAYLDQVLTQLEPAAKEVLNQMAESNTKRPLTSLAKYTDEELVVQLEAMEISRLKDLLR